jgi:hypothetical protein
LFHGPQAASRARRIVRVRDFMLGSAVLLAALASFIAITLVV